MKSACVGNELSILLFVTVSTSWRLNICIQVLKIKCLYLIHILSQIFQKLKIFFLILNKVALLPKLQMGIEHWIKSPDSFVWPPFTPTHLTTARFINAVFYSAKTKKAVQRWKMWWWWYYLGWWHGYSLEVLPPPKILVASIVFRFTPFVECFWQA